MRSILFSILLLIGTPLLASNFNCTIEKPAAAEQNKLVWQYTDLLSASEEQRLNAKLGQFARETSNRILVLIVDTLCGYPASDLAFEIGETWGIGKAGSDNGLIILIQPTGPPGQRDWFIATGYGLEGAIPDLTAKKVGENEMIPLFQQQRYFDGLDRATDVLMAMAKGEFDEKSYGKAPEGAPAGGVIMFLVIMVIVFLSWRGRVNRYARTNKVDFWTAMFLLSQMNQRHGRGGGGFGGFGGGGFGGGGGGFGGFGGGSFGGGGAGGRW